MFSLVFMTFGLNLSHLNYYCEVYFVLLLMYSIIKVIDSYFPCFNQLNYSHFQNLMSKYPFEQFQVQCFLNLILLQYFMMRFLWVSTYKVNEAYMHYLVTYSNKNAKLLYLKFTLLAMFQERKLFSCAAFQIKYLSYAKNVLFHTLILRCHSRISSNIWSIKDYPYFNYSNFQYLINSLNCCCFIIQKTILNNQMLKLLNII